MSGGTFLSMNKVRPGAYFNFKSVPKSLMTVGDRGIATIPLQLNWGSDDALIDVYSDELLNGDSVKKVGFDAFDAESKLVNLLLQYCYMVKIFRINNKGEKAKAEIGTDNKLGVTAKYSGTFGNKITVSVVQEGELYNVSTFVDGKQVDSQKVATITELEENDYVVFSGTGVPEENAGKPLTGGTNGETQEKATYYPDYLKLLETARWQTMGCPDLADADTTLKANIVTFIKNQRDGEGRYVQAVVANYPTADNEGIISVKNGTIINEVEFTKEDMCAVVAGMTAGATVVESNTNKVITGATDIIGKYTNSEIIAALKNGEFVFTANQRGEIKVEQDINSYHTFITDKNNAFAKNRIIRTLDEIGTTIKDVWEQSFMGKQNNNEDGRGVFKSNLIDYFNQLQNLGAIQNFAGADDIAITQGADLDVAVVEAYIQPVDSMEKLYFTCNVIG